MKVRTRKIMMTALVAAFFGQTAMVYMDDTADRNLPLSEEAMRGRAIWHDHNCQACHQFYGFGGFLGPDLTNAAPRLNRERLDDILTNGNAQMPAFHFNSSQIDAIQAFLVEIDKTGVGQARSRPPVDPQLVFSLVEEVAVNDPLPSAAAAGRETFRIYCASCHTLFRANALGTNVAPDLSNVVERLTDAEIRKTLVEGRIDRGMPALQLPDEKHTEIIAWFHWLASHRETIAARIESEPQPLPWFEFK